jgi:DbpA-like RNA binding protein
VTTVVEARAALERGRPVVVVTPPAPDQAGALWELVEVPGRPHGDGPLSPTTAHGPAANLPLLIVCADAVSVTEWADAAPSDRRVHVVTGLRRSERCLRDLSIDVVAGTVDDLSALVARSALKLDTVSTIVVAWPEQLVASDEAGALDTLLGGAPDARRVVLCWDPGALTDFLERHARRAEVVGMPTLDGKLLPPIGPARYAVAPRSRHPALLQEALDLLDPKQPLVWEGGALDAVDAPDAVFCLRVPSREQFIILSQLTRDEPIIFLQATQLPYLRSIAMPLTPARLPTAADRAQGRAQAVRARIAQLLETRQPDGELAVLGPLFERFDPAEVAAALLAILGDEGRGTGDAVAPSVTPGSAASVRVFVNVGTKDRASAKDLVGALIKEVKIGKGDIGRIDVRETFTVVEVAAGVADRVVRELSGVTIRGRRAMARLDRYSQGA